MIKIRLKEHLVHLCSKDGIWQEKTWDIDWLENKGNIIEVKFKRSNQAYKYTKNRVRFEKGAKAIDLTKTKLVCDGQVQNKLVEAYTFKKHIVYYTHTGFRKVCEASEVELIESCINDKDIASVLAYQKDLASYLECEGGDTPFLQGQLEGIRVLSRESTLATYLKAGNNTYEDQGDLFIYPFGINESQKQAAEASFQNKISVIQGPPGTGKTQTILTIIANALYRHQNVAVVSGNNSATSNVYEKLEKNGYGFLAASLGNKDNVEKFLKETQYKHGHIENWIKDEEAISDSKENAIKELKDLDQQLRSLNQRQVLLDYKTQLETEQRHYLKRKNIRAINLKDYVLVGSWTSKQILTLISELEALEMQNSDLKIMDRVRLFIKYRFKKFRIKKEELIDLVPAMQVYYYEKAIEETKEKIESIQKSLKASHYDDLMKSFIKRSHVLMKHMVYERRKETEDIYFDKKTYKTDFDRFIKKYPVVLSTTHSIRMCIPETFLFDVLIIDEASQVDLMTASIAMSCCKRLVIVGDPMQLPPIVTGPMKKANSLLTQKYEIDEAYNYEKHSIIDSLALLYKDSLKITLLKEHYRCHPQIIRFCNQKYYNDELVIMTKEASGDNRLRLVKTADGNHERRSPNGGWINRRELEVIRDELLPNIDYDDENIGIVTPYREQANLGHIIGRKKILTETVHKFQGREKDSIILSTVKKTPDDFNDDKRLVNVAVSRAVNELNVIVGAGFEAKHGSHIGDLVKYIEYVAGDAGVYESKKVSIFDCLYKEYSELLIPLLKKLENISEYKSENLMYTLIKKVLSDHEKYQSLSVVPHFPLHFLIHDQEGLSQREHEFVNHPFTHTDFVIFNKLNKEPVLVIEVDGYAYHDSHAKQLERDKIKDKVLKSAGYKLMRFSTIGSGEEERLIEGLDGVVC